MERLSLAVPMNVSSFALQLVVVRCFALTGIAGTAVPLLPIAFCMASAHPSYEFLP